MSGDIKYKYDDFESVITALAKDIRGSWQYAEGRMDTMIELCKVIDRYDLVSEIEDIYEDCIQDGRYMRDCFSFETIIKNCDNGNFLYIYYTININSGYDSNKIKIGIPYKKIQLLVADVVEGEGLIYINTNNELVLSSKTIKKIKGYICCQL
jgi:hypothetical protein